MHGDYFIFTYYEPHVKCVFSPSTSYLTSILLVSVTFSRGNLPPFPLLVYLCSQNNHKATFEPLYSQCGYSLLCLREGEAEGEPTEVRGAGMGHLRTGSSKMLLISISISSIIYSTEPRGRGGGGEKMEDQTTRRREKRSLEEHVLVWGEMALFFFLLDQYNSAAISIAKQLVFHSIHTFHPHRKSTSQLLLIEHSAVHKSPKRERDRVRERGGGRRRQVRVWQKLS